MVKKANSLQHRFPQLAEHFHKFYQLYDQLQPHLQIDEALHRYIDRRRSWVNRLQQPEFPVAFLGSFTTGKSTISNALIGRNLLPENPEATTAVPTFIRQGNEPKATIYFLDAEARRALFNMYVDELAQQISEKLPHCGQEDNPMDILITINERLGEVKQLEEFDEEDLLALHYLKDHWHDNRPPHPITLDELGKYVENYQDIKLVDRIEISLPLPLPTGVVLVDLPGLGVANPRHRKITRDYVEKDAKAFVICMKWNHLLEGEEIEVLEAIHRQNKRVLQRAFWLINQWDIANNLQRRQTQENFTNKVNQKNFQIQTDRLFHVSALQYLLLRSIANNTLSEHPELVEHLDVLDKIANYQDGISAEKAQALLQSHRDTADFQRFRDQLIQYLEGTAEQEFYIDAMSELDQLIRRFTEILEPDYRRFRDSKNLEEDLKQEFLFLEVQERLRSFQETIDEIAKEFRTKTLDKIEAFPTNALKRIEAEVKQRLKRLDEDVLLNELRAGQHRNATESRLMPTIEARASIEQMLFNEIRNAAVKQVHLHFIQHLQDHIQEQGSLPDEISTAVEHMLDQQRFEERIKGLGDALLFDYGRIVNQISKTSFSNESKGTKNSSDRKFIKTGLALFEKGMLEFVKELPQKANPLAQRCIKNYAEEIITRLPLLFKEQQAAIARQINQAGLLPSHLQHTIDRHKLIVEAFEQLAAIRQGKTD